VVTVRGKLFDPDESIIMVASGRMICSRLFFQERLREALRALCPGDRLIIASNPPELGAARLAAQAAGISLPPPSSAAEETGQLLTPPPELEADRRRVFDECRQLPTEQRNPRAERIDEAEIIDILKLMNEEDQGVAPAVGTQLPAIADAVAAIVEVFNAGGRLFYLGAGTSGRLGCLDASECPPTFGAPPEMVQGVIAGGMATLLRSREGAEDRAEEAARDLALRGFGKKDMLVGLAASRRTPYVLAGLEYAHQLGARTALITCSPPEQKPACIDIVIAPVVGSEVVTGSTRLKAATAQKMILNMLTTASMIRLGKVYENMMIDLTPSCGKLVERAKRIVMTITGVDYDSARALLHSSGGSVKRALVIHATGASNQQATDALNAAHGFVRSAIQRLQNSEPS
jgi:N-acetylmuramic acid 6-phosphate etherase